jgi:malate dehydrogenase (oxaloacetate-decarboxylating)(NADP+)
MSMQKEGLSLEDARKRIYMLDSKGLLVKGRDNMSAQKEKFARDDMQPTKELKDVVKAVKPTAIIGAATIPQVFTEEIVRDMGMFNERPIIMALSNPTSKAECTAEQAYDWTEGRAVFASGSPFPEYRTKSGNMLYPGQGNNAYIFPGVALATITCGIHHVTDEHFLIASQAVADMVEQRHLEEGRVYPPLSGIRDISLAIATKIAEHCYKTGEAAYYPEPLDKREFIQAQMYDTEYEDHDPHFYDWPEEHMVKHI